MMQLYKISALEALSFLATKTCCAMLQLMQHIAAMERKSAITKYREENNGMTLEAFGQLFAPAVDKSTVLRWERGKVNLRRAIEIERVTGISRRELLPEFFAEAAE